jgi:nitric oxide reductase subunit B
MCFATLFPLGVLQLYHSIDVSYYDARTLNFVTDRTNAILQWLRLPGDVLFIVGGVLPLLYLTVLGLRYRKEGEVTEEPKEILFTETIVVPEER